MKRSERYFYQAKCQFLRACLGGLLAIVAASFGYVSYLTQSPLGLIGCAFATVALAAISIAAGTETLRLFRLSIEEEKYEIQRSTRYVSSL